MAEIIVSTAVTALFDKVLSGDLMKLTRFQGIESQLVKLKTKWRYFDAVLADASEKNITQEVVKLWMQDLHSLAYDIEDVLDDMATEPMRRKLNDESRGSTSTGKVLKKIIPTFCTNFTPHNIMYGRKMRSMLDDISEKLNMLAENKNIHGIDFNTIVALKSNRNIKRSEETSLSDMNDESPVGREKDEAAVLEKLLGDESCNQNVSVVSIVGFGGVGKTTLARLLYNNQKVKDYFELRAWVCVSNDFNVLAISKAIYEAVTKENSTHASLNPLHEALKEKLSNKRFLLVLDDVWNEDRQKWKALEKSLKGAPGSKILVTARKSTVASTMESVEQHNLGFLSDEDALSLLAKSAIGKHNFHNHPLLSLAKDIIKKCKGLPLALLAIGRVLNGKNNDEWDKLSKSEIWSSDDGEGDILPALKLSYYDLPLHLKKLFVYCCFFPKDYLFDMNEIVLLWMAEGFISESKHNKTMESLGRQYFKDLFSRSFFQLSTKNKSEYVMHDLMHDLALIVAGEFFLMLDDKMNVNGSNEAFYKLRHFSWLAEGDAEFRNFKELCRSRCLRTFLMLSLGWEHRSHCDLWLPQSTVRRLDHYLIKLLPRLQLLRVLKLNKCVIKSVPQSIGRLKHLRYLNLSRTRIKKVPEQVTKLYNLQSLLVSDCPELSRLPVSFSKLRNLRHLDMSNTPKLKKTPLGICGLTSLQTLTKVFIQGTNGFKLSDLQGLVNLEGHLSIIGLGKVTDPQQARDANLEGKKGLVSLDMNWSSESDGSRNLNTEYKVIEKLRPHNKLNKLKMLNYGGMEVPSWFAHPSFDKLTHLTIGGFTKFTHIHVAFPSLEYLKISDMHRLEEWVIRDGDQTIESLPHLREICIENCKKLAPLSIGLPALEVLVLKGCTTAFLRAMVGQSSTIHNLAICKIKNLAKLARGVLKHLTRLQTLKIEQCDNLRYLWGSESKACTLLVKLQTLKVIECRNLVSMGEREVNVGSSNMKLQIKEVTFEFCNSLESYSCPNSVEKLDIRGCGSMTSFCDEQLQSLTSLEEMSIIKCENMDESFPSGLWPPNLRKLRIGELKKPMSEWGLQNYPTSLIQLTLYGNNSGVTAFAMEGDAMNTASTSFLLPPSLIHLIILDFKDVKSISKELLQRLTRLQTLSIDGCPNIRDVPQSTSSLTVYYYNTYKRWFE